MAVQSSPFCLNSPHDLIKCCTCILGWIWVYMERDLCNLTCMTSIVQSSVNDPLDEKNVEVADVQYTVFAPRHFLGIVYIPDRQDVKFGESDRSLHIPWYLYRNHSSITKYWGLSAIQSEPSNRIREYVVQSVSVVNYG